jgi:hypothetical protein
MNAEHLKRGAALYFANKCYAVASEVGLNKHGGLRADLLAVNMAADIVVVEVKSSVADFRQDRKWWNYIDYGNRLYFCISPAVYEKIFDLIPKGIGILVVDEFGTAKVKQPAQRRVMDEAINKNVIIRMLFRDSMVSRYRRSKNQVLRASDLKEV